MGNPKCIGTIRRKYFGTSSCVLCREIVLISERPVLDSTVLTVCMVHYTCVQYVWFTIRVYSMYGPLYVCTVCMVHYTCVQYVWFTIRVYSMYGSLYVCTVCMVHYTCVQCVWSTIRVYSVYGPLYVCTVCMVTRM